MSYEYIIGLTWAIITAALWGTRDVILKRGVESGGIMETVLINAVVSAGSALVLALWLGELWAIFTMDSLTIFAFLAAGILQFFVAVWLYYEGVKKAGASRTSSVSLIQSFVAPYLGILLLGEPAAVSIIMGVLIGALGILLVSHRGGLGFTPAVLYGLGAGLCWSTTPLILRYFYERARVPFLATFLGAGASLIFIITALFLQEGWRGWNRFTVSAGSLGGLGQATLYLSLAYAPTVIVIPVSNLKAVITIALSLLLIREIERVTWKIVVGALLIILGVILVNLGA